MYNYIKTALIVLFTLLAFILLIACDLSENMRSGVTADEFYSTDAGFEDLAVAMYEPLRQYYGVRRAGYIMTSKGTDIFKYGTGARPYWATYSGINPTVQSMTARGPFRIWQQFYRGVNLTNSVIARADDVQDIEEDLKNRLVAEAHFLRAHYYHILVQTWGNIHLSLEETQGVETEVNYVSEDEVWPHIISDLEFAITNLPPVQNQLGRATSSAAQHLLSRVHLILGNWQEAANLSTDLIQSGNHSLEESVLDLWDPCRYRGGNASNETIFAMTKNQDIRFGSTVHKSREYASRTRGEAGVTADFAIGTQVSRHRPTEFFITEVFGNTPEHGVNQWNDERWKLFKDVWYFNDEGGLPEGAALGDTALYFTTTPDWQELSREEVDAIEEERGGAIRIFRIEDYTDRLWVSLAYKFRLCDPSGSNIPHKGLPVRNDVGGGNPEWFGRTVNIFRLAETYLIAAESLMNLNQRNEAAEYFNALRQRAQTPGQTIELVSPNELDIDVILDERARELVGEHLRWFDLKRLGEDVFLRRIREHNPQAAPNVQAYHMLRPIPQEQIDRTTNEFPQNPGY